MRNGMENPHSGLQKTLRQSSFGLIGPKTDGEYGNENNLLMTPINGINLTSTLCGIISDRLLVSSALANLLRG